MIGAQCSHQHKTYREQEKSCEWHEQQFLSVIVMAVLCDLLQKKSISHDLSQNEPFFHMHLAACTRQCKVGSSSENTWKDSTSIPYFLKSLAMSHFCTK